jgi:hypothetical protein
MQKVKTYYISVGTFRRTLELRIGGDKKYFNKEYSELGFDYDLTGGFYYFDPNNNCNVIWLRDYNLNTLVHELIHCVIEMLDQVGVDPKGEPIAYMYEEMFTKIMSKCGKYFKLDADTKAFYNLN